MGTTTTFNIEEIDWEEVYIKLYAFADYSVKTKTWVKGYSALPKGKTVEDLVYETIEKFLLNPEKFNSSRGKFIPYLKYNILQQIISNLSKSAANTKHDDIDLFSSTNLFADTEFLNENIDIGFIEKKIEEELANKPILENIYYYKYHETYTRKEICLELDLPTNKYDNYIRQLRRVIKKILKEYKYEI